MKWMFNKRLSLKRLKARGTTWLSNRGWFGLGQRIGSLLIFFLAFLIGGSGLFQWGYRLILSEIEQVQVAQEITTETNQILLKLYQAQAHESTFLAHPSNEEAQAFLEQVAEVKQITDKLSTQALDPKFKDQVHDLGDVVEGYQESFDQIRSYRESMGFSPTLGFRGRLRASGAKMQAAFVKLNRSDLLFSLQTIQLAQRDFFLGQLSAGRVVKEKMTLLRSQLASVKGAGALTKPAGLIDGYLSNFDRVKLYTYKINDLTESFKQEFNEIPEMLAGLDALALERQNIVGQKARQVMIDLGNQFLLLGVCSLCFVGLFGWLLTRSILGPVKAVVGLTDELSKGNLTSKLETSSRDEIGKMSKSLNRFTLSLKRTIGGIHVNSDVLNTTSIHLAASTRQIEATADLANQSVDSSNQRLQAASQNLQDLAKSNEEITKGVGHLVEAASTTAQAAQLGQQNMGAVKGCMEDIDRSSSSMFAVIQGMEKIRSRVEMLSFNATIESARAGIAGKGFMVVASEIRRLSEHTKEELAKIEALVLSSREHVVFGKKTVSRTSEQISRVVEQVESINRGLQQITLPILEQDLKTKQLSKDTQDLSQLSAQNSSTLFELAATVRQVDQTTEELSVMAAELRSQVLVFKVS